MWWDPHPDLFIIPFIDWPIKWYGFFFAFGFIGASFLFQKFLQQRDLTQEKIAHITDRLTLYVVAAVIVGARLGHFLFYERITHLSDLLHIFNIREGFAGLASHGAIALLLPTLWFFSRTSAGRSGNFTFLQLLDALSIPAAFVSGWIRIGNFFNQEILGKPTSLSWGIIFGHPADGSIPLSRHPVQLYEAFFYFGLFFLLRKIALHFKQEGTLFGLFFSLLFIFRFFVEFVKEEQSVLLSSHACLTMGQWLSLPLIGIGLGILAKNAWLERNRRSTMPPG